MNRDRWLRNAILKRLTQGKCPACDYSLLGLGVSDGTVRCPECGLVTTLAERGLTPQDLLAPAAPSE